MRMLPEPMPLLLGELHTLPIVIACSILSAKFDAPRLAGCAFSRRDVGLKFHCIGTSFSNGIDIGVCHTKTSIVPLSHFGDEEYTVLQPKGSSSIGLTHLQGRHLTPNRERYRLVGITSK